jgi:deoxyribonuclease-4
MTLNKDKVRICIDTAHLWGVGEYDLRDVDEIDRFIDDMERYGIMDRWKLLHLNDSGVPFGSHKDRHASIGTGYIWNKNVTSLIYLLDKCNRFGINIVMETCLEDMIFISELNYLV